MTPPGAVAIALDDVLCDTRPLWNDWLESTAAVLGVDPGELPDDRGEAAAELDGRAVGNWRTLLGRWAEERAPVYLRRDAGTGHALRALGGAGARVGVFTDAPEELARVALGQLGLDRRIAALETGASARGRLLGQLGPDAVVVETREGLLELAP
jgi:phosphoglycolate phosphatase-like HAD superfamily hydrolase